MSIADSFLISESLCTLLSALVASSSLGGLEKHVAAVVSGLPVMAMDWEMVELWDLS